MKEVIFKALLEALRVMVLAAIPVLIDGLAKGVVDLRLVAITVAIAGLRFLDKFLHEIGKANNNDVLTKGLTRF